jgi:Spy/CpxP family protein refolding chaperone
MQTQKYHSWNWALVAGILCLVLMAASWSFGQEPPLQQNGTESGGPFMRPDGNGGPMHQGMPEQGMRRQNGPGMMPRSMNMEGRNSADLLRPGIQKELAITSEQRQKLEDIRFNHEKESIQHRASLEILRLELSRLIKSENPDRAVIDKKVQEVSQEEASLLRSSINSRLNARAVLTAEQRAKLAQIMQNRMNGNRRPAGAGMLQGQLFPRAGRAREQAPSPAAPAKP